MAEAGFYHVGSESEPDLVRCYYCRRELDGWEPTDVPWDEHKRRECPFILLGKTPQDLTIEDTFDLEAARKCLIVVRITNYFDHSKKASNFPHFREPLPKMKSKSLESTPRSRRGKLSLWVRFKEPKRINAREKPSTEEMNIAVLNKNYKIDNTHKRIL